MMDATRIHGFNSFARMMYAYSTPEIARHNGWLKIGDTISSLCFIKESSPAGFLFLLCPSSGLLLIPSCHFSSSIFPDKPTIRPLFRTK